MLHSGVIVTAIPFPVQADSLSVPLTQLAGGATAPGDGSED